VSDPCSLSLGGGSRFEGTGTCGASPRWPPHLRRRDGFARPCGL